MSSRRFHWNRRTGCAIFAVAMYVSGSACARAAPDDMASSACNSRDTFRIVALGGLFPIPTYLAVNTLPGTSSAPWVVSLSRLREEPISGDHGSIRFGSILFSDEVALSPPKLAGSAARSKREMVGDVEIVFFDLDRPRELKGAIVDSGASITMHNSRVEFYGKDMEREIACLVQIFRKARVSGH